MIAESQLQEEKHLVNYDNYGPFKRFVERQDLPFSINTDHMNIDNWQGYYEGIMNVFRDGIETDLIREKKIKIVFGDTGMKCSLYLPELYLNIIMWRAMVAVNSKVKPYHLMYNREGITADDLKDYIDNYLIKPYRSLIPNKTMNNVIDDTLCNLFPINDFYAYLADTLNLEDSLELARLNNRYNQLLHMDLSDESVEDVNNIAMQLTNEMIDLEIKAKQWLGYDHCLANAWRAKESVNRKQYKEAAMHIGTKPDGNGSVFAHSINRSFMNGGVADIADFFIDAHAARTAQILSHHNVGSSGHFARLLGLNNSDTFLSKEVDRCNTVNLIEVTLKTNKHFKMYVDRYYRMHPRGEVKLLTFKDKDLIGKTIQVYSPMMCNSHSHGDGICHRCYGDLAYANMDINVGKMAAELISSKLTQILLSAKHLLEALVKKVVWTKGFEKFFEMEYNSIRLLPDFEMKDAFMVIDPELINIENEEDYDEESAASALKEYIPTFKIVVGKEEFVIEDEDGRDLYISAELNDAIRRHAKPVDGMIYVPMEELDDVPLFFIRLINNELSRVMDRLMAILNKKNVTETFDANGIVQDFVDTIVTGGLNLQAVHCEIVLANQIRNAENMFDNIDWSYPNALYRITTLNDSLTNNKSVTISLMYQKLGKTLYNPLTYKKTAPSFIDLFFMEQPQKFLNSKFAKSKYDSEVPNQLPFTIQPDIKEQPVAQKKVEVPFTIK